MSRDVQEPTPHVAPSKAEGSKSKYKRILLKLSGEALMGEHDFGIDPKVLDRMALEIGQLVGIGVQVGIVIGGGNLFRGARVMSAIPMSGVVEHYDRRTAIRYLTSGDVVLFSAGTGNPFFTTDSAACLRGIEVDADVVIKATKVDGVYNKDPVKHPDAVKYDQLSYDDALDQKLGVMDLTAICLVRDHNMPVRVFDMNKPGALLNMVVGGKEGTLIYRG